MRKLLTAAWLPLLLIGACGESPEPAGEKPKAAPKGTAYGEKLSDAESIRISELVARVDEFKGKRVKVEGLITGVCAKRGCWLTLASDKQYQSIRFKVTDGVMVFPMSAKGKYAVAEGTVKKTAMSLEQTRSYLAHQAEEAGEKFDPESVSEPLTSIQLQGLGAVISDRKLP